MKHGRAGGNKCVPAEHGFVTFGILLAQWSETTTNPPHLYFSLDTLKLDIPSIQ
jgi:hypothetical protein